MRRLQKISLGLLAVAFLSGCGSRGGPTNANLNLGVRGRLALPGELRSPVVIQFFDDQGGMIAYTTVNPPNGEFDIPGPSMGPGIPPGRYKVVVVDPGGQADIPKAWQDVSTTPLKVSVTETTAGNLQIGP